MCENINFGLFVTHNSNLHFKYKRYRHSIHNSFVSILNLIHADEEPRCTQLRLEHIFLSVDGQWKVTYFQFFVPVTRGTCTPLCGVFTLIVQVHSESGDVTENNLGFSNFNCVFMRHFQRASNMIVKIYIFWSSKWEFMCNESNELTKSFYASICVCST